MNAARNTPSVLNYLLETGIDYERESNPSFQVVQGFSRKLLNSLASLVLNHKYPKDAKLILKKTVTKRKTVVCKPSTLVIIKVLKSYV